MRPKRRISMDSDIDEVPLTKYIRNGQSSHSTKSCQKLSLEKLRRYSIQTCEFCEAKCENRFDMLIHNSTHIIIPLLKDTPCRCHKCGAFCISEEHLINHLSFQHNILLGSKKERKHRPFKEEYETEHYANNEALNYMVKTEQLNDAGLLQSFFMNCKVDVEKFVTPWLESDIDVEEHKYIGVNGINSFTDIIKMESSSERLINHDYNHTVNDVGRKCNGNTEQRWQSVHYDDLMKPGLYRCKHCVKMFSTRYDVIVHEATHISLSSVLKKKRGRPRKCLQILEKQSNVNILNTPKQCDVCKYWYTSWYLDRHVKNCAATTHRQRRTVKVCDVCIHAGLNRAYSVRGTDDSCTNFCFFCGNKCQRLTIVKLRRRYKTKAKPAELTVQRLADKIQFEDCVRESESEWNSEMNCQLKTDKKSKPRKTNNERLKLIQQRFKLINKSEVYVSKFAKEGRKNDKKTG